MEKYISSKIYTKGGPEVNRENKCSGYSVLGYK